MFADTISLFSASDWGDLTPELLALLGNLTGPVYHRREAAYSLARHFGLSDLLIFSKDPELDVLLPVAGFPQTLPHGHRWHAFLSDCLLSPGHLKQGTLPFLLVVEEAFALGLASSTGELVLVGLKYNLEQTQLEPVDSFSNSNRETMLSLPVLNPLMPFLTAVYRQERMALNAQGYARLAEQNAAQAQTLAHNLDSLRLDLQKALDEASEANRAKAEILQVLELFLANTPVGLAYLDRDLRYRHINPTLAAFTNLSLEAHLGHTLNELQPKMAARFETHLQTVLAKGQAVLGVEINAADVMAGETGLLEKPRYWLVNFYPVTSTQSGSFIEGVGMVVIEVTTLKELEAERFRAGQLEALGVLAGGIAHDFNNLLASSLGNISYARSTLGTSVKAEYAELLAGLNPVPGKGDSEQALLEAEKAILRAKELTGQLLTFSRGGDPQKTTLDIAHLLREVTDLALPGTTPLEVKYSIANDLWAVEADAVQLGRVLQNLIVNAVEATPSGGASLYFKITNVVLGEKEVANLPAGNYLNLSIKDEGSGIENKILPRIFDPYFTTKPGASGLGLAIGYSIISKHNGHIEVNSLPGQGTTFNLYLPAVTSASSSDTTATQMTAEILPVSSQEATTSRRVLIVDDEASIRRLTERVLSKQGYEVTAVENGYQALEQYRAALEQGQLFKVVITDLTMPGSLGGEEIARRILELNPAAILLVSSGYGDNQVLSDYRSYGFRGIIPKPYTVQELLKIIEQYM
ncbi:MAG TPA: ATP-binding protein [Chloroflexia bacterium]|nr:ATP-binding protein [Chloroflexia bacterium]